MEREDSGSPQSPLSGQPESLPTTVFNVVKLHHRNKYYRLDRRLRLCKDGLQNCKPDGAITKAFRWDSVRCVALRGVNRVVISYFTDHDFIYETQEAMQIEAQVNHWLAFSRAKGRLQEMASITAYQQQLGVEITEIEELFVRSCSEQSVPLPVTFSVGGRYTRLEEEITRLVKDKGKEEGVLIVDFLRAFDSLFASLRDARHTMAQTRLFLDKVKGFILERRATELCTAKQEDEASSLGTEPFTDISDVVEVVLQRTIIKPLHDRLLGLFNGDEYYMQKETQLQENITLLRNKPQSYYGIGEGLTGPQTRDWAMAIREMRNFNSADTVTAKMECLVLCAKSIYITFNYSRNLGRAVKQQFFLDADSFLPIFMFVLVRSNISHAFATCEFLQTLSDQENIASEQCYYLTVFTSALEYLLNIDIATGEMRPASEHFPGSPK